MKYKITRFYRDIDKEEVVKTGLTLEEARAHCTDPETSSSTCTNKDGLERLAKYGPWFDGFEEQRVKPGRTIENLKSPLSIWTKGMTIFMDPQ